MLFIYSIEIWDHRLSNTIVESKLKSIQAVSIRGDLPNETLCVLAKQVPLHLELQHIRAHIDLYKRGRLIQLDKLIRVRKNIY